MSIKAPDGDTVRDSTAVLLIALVIYTFFFDGDPDIHDHIRDWFDCLTACDVGRTGGAAP